MERITVRRWAGILKAMVTAAMLLAVLALILTPWFFLFCWPNRNEMAGELGGAQFLRELLFSYAMVFWRPADALPTFFYWAAGGCAAGILWQARRVLDTVLAGNPFQMENARALKRAADCCWVISATAAARLCLWLWTDGDAGPLFTYNALFIPAFLVAGLLLVVVSALFEDAARMQEDQDLTI